MRRHQNLFPRLNTSGNHRHMQRRRAGIHADRGPGTHPRAKFAFQRFDLRSEAETACLENPGDVLYGFVTNFRPLKRQIVKWNLDVMHN